MFRILEGAERARESGEQAMLPARLLAMVFGNR